MAVPVGGAVAGILGMFLVVPVVAIVSATWRLVVATIEDDEVAAPRGRAAPVRDAGPGLAGGVASSHRPVHDSSGPRRSIRSNPVSAEPRSISAAVARRFLVTRHLLAPPRSLPAEPGSVMRVVDRLGSLQFDPIDVAGRNHDLTLLARIAGYRRDLDGRAPVPGPRAVRDLQQDALDRAHGRAAVVPDHLGPPPEVAHDGGAFDEHAPLVEELLERIRTSGAAVVDRHRAARGDRLVLAADQPGARAARGARGGRASSRSSRREGNRRVYDLTERLFPAELLARRLPARRAAAPQAAVAVPRQRAAGRDGRVHAVDGPRQGARAARACTQELVEAGAITPVAVEGLRGLRFVVTDELPMLDAAEAEVALEAGSTGRRGRAAASPGVAFLAPLDPLAWDRDLLERLFGLRVPLGGLRARRRSDAGATTCCRCCTATGSSGRIEPRIDRATGTLRVLGLWWEAGFDPLDAANPGFAASVAAALRRMPTSRGCEGGAAAEARHRAFVREVRERL